MGSFLGLSVWVFVVFVGVGVLTSVWGSFLMRSGVQNGPQFGRSRNLSWYRYYRFQIWASEGWFECVFGVPFGMG